MTTEERLKQYIDNDEVYQDYKNGNINLTDFEKFCIQHCKDIEEILEENQELKKQLDELQTSYNNMFKCHCNRVQVETLLEQQKEFIEYLKNKEKEFDMMGDPINSGACLGILREYKEIIGDKE